MDCFQVWKNGRGDRIRTCDLVVPNDARYQLRYTPIWMGSPEGIFLKESRLCTALFAGCR